MSEPVFINYKLIQEIITQDHIHRWLATHDKDGKTVEETESTNDDQE